jgi:hypothetical protein
MTDNTTTSINDLPTDPIGGGSIGGNISLIANEQKNQMHSNSPLSLDETTISQIVNGIQQASINGVTTLPSRDIPQQTNTITQDAFINPNYIPPSNNKNDYIKDEPIEITYQQENITNSMDKLYDELQTPLLLGILYFIFQLPIFKRTLYKYIYFLFNNDGNYNLNGLIFVSSLFGITYYSLSKFMNHFSKF